MGLSNISTYKDLYVWFTEYYDGVVDILEMFMVVYIYYFY